MSSLAVDYSFARPSLAQIKADGYKGVLRYLSGDSKKDVSRSEVAAIHGHGLWLALVWETTAGRAAKGRLAGRMDRRKAESMAKALGMPIGCVIFYAVDGDYSPAQVAPYMSGVLDGHNYQLGIYGSARIVDGFPRWWGWQTEAWSHGAVSGHANLLQRAGASKVKGTDENVVLRPFPVWVPTSHPAPAPVPTPSHSPSPDDDLVVAFDRWKSAKGLH